MNANDTELLQRYAKQADQSAFAQLVEHNIDVAYSAAIAVLKREDLARDACQLTFLELAKHARRLTDGVRLGGWIYLTARNLSRNILRMEISRQQREQNYVSEMKTHPQTKEDWSQIAPDIHEAIEQLKAPERDAVILRFFKDKTLAEVGEALGVSADAARKRVNRALEHLNSGLAQKGITSTAAALAAALPAHAAVTAPTGLAASISTTALAGAGTLMTSTTLTGAAVTAMKAKTLIITVVAAVTVGGGVYFATHSPSGKDPGMADPQQTADRNITDVESPAGSGAMNTRSSSDVNRLASNREAEGMRGSTQAGSPVAGDESEHDAPEIAPEYLKQAEQTLSVMEILAKAMDTDMVQIGAPMAALDTDSITRKLQLRMGMDEEQAARLHEILQVYADGAQQQVKEQNEKQLRAFMAMMEEDREDLLGYLALEAMKAGGAEMTPEQMAYYQSLSDRLEAAMGLDPSSHVDYPKEWYENEDVLSELNMQLSRDQQEELASYIDEQQIRQREQQALSRANELAHTLGLNEADRGALYDYLYENPEASNEEITDMLSPELRDLMPGSDASMGNVHVSIAPRTEADANTGGE